MTFDEIPLYKAIHDFYRVSENHRSEKWLLEKKKELLLEITRGLEFGHGFSESQAIDAWMTYGKSSKVPGGTISKLALTVEVARLHGEQCFWQNRGKGTCSDNVDLDRLTPGSRGGQYTVENCILSCSFHNRQRNDRSVERYLRKDVP